MTAPEATSVALRRQTDAALIVACADTLEAVKALQRCLDIRDTAVANAARRSACSVRKVGKHIRSTLAAAGFTDEDIAVLGVSDANIRLIRQRS